MFGRDENLREEEEEEVVSFARWRPKMRMASTLKQPHPFAGNKLERKSCLDHTEKNEQGKLIKN